jgi:hypothetical protein
MRRLRPCPDMPSQSTALDPLARLPAPRAVSGHATAVDGHNRSYRGRSFLSLADRPFFRCYARSLQTDSQRRPDATAAEGGGRQRSVFLGRYWSGVRSLTATLAKRVPPGRAAGVLMRIIQFSVPTMNNSVGYGPPVRNAAEERVFRKTLNAQGGSPGLPFGITPSGTAWRILDLIQGRS